MVVLWAIPVLVVLIAIVFIRFEEHGSAAAALVLAFVFVVAAITATFGTDINEILKGVIGCLE